MSPRVEEIPKVLGIYLQISQYPILGRIIRERMRQELFERGIITPEQFRQEVKEKARLSQQREGTLPGQDSDEVWQERLNLIQDHLTDFYFAYNLPHSLFEEILQEVLASRAMAQKDVLPFNPELAPRSVLIAQAKEFAALPEEQRRQVRHHLEEIIVVLIKRMISDQPDFVRLAKRFLEPGDFEMIYGRRIGTGKIGGKAAGMILAWEILKKEEPDDEIELRKYVRLPDSYFIGANVFYDFHALNGLEEFINQKYKTQEEIEADYPRIQEIYGRGRFPAEVMDRLRALLVELGRTPIIVRSSSLLEDNFGFSFAGKYESIFCPNQGTLEENLQALTRAIARVYASVLNPDALLYRHQMGLVDFDERMAILIQRVQGQRYRDFFLPAVAGVGFSYNPFRWSRRIRREDGLLRIVWGLGTRAVDRVANDYPRMVPLSHPLLRPETGADQIRKYSQHFVDLIDLRENQFKTLPVAGVLRADYPAIKFLASQDHGDYLSELSCAPGENAAFVLTFENLLKNQRFITLIRSVLKKLERHYERPVDIEFTIEITDEHPPEFVLHLLQCRPLSRQEWGENARIPGDVLPEDIVFLSRRLAPSGRVSNIRYIVYVVPEQYNQVPDYETRFEVARVIGRLNKRLKGETFILMGPGRWGTSNVELGLKVTYADIYNARALIEIARSPTDDTLEVSYGTHFFQDLVESRIYPLPLYPNAADTIFNHAFFERAENRLEELLPGDAQYARFVKVIDVPAASGGRYLELVMDGERDEALAYLKVPSRSAHKVG
jgi:hypothetical protein